MVMTLRVKTTTGTVRTDPESQDWRHTYRDRGGDVGNIDAAKWTLHNEYGEDSDHDDDDDGDDTASTTTITTATSTTTEATTTDTTTMTTDDHDDYYDEQMNRIRLLV